MFDHVFSIQQILKKNWEYNNEECQLFIGIENANDFIKR